MAEIHERDLFHKISTPKPDQLTRAKPLLLTSLNAPQLSGAINR